MKKSNPYCPTCNGRGWYEGPGSDPNFGPSLDLYPCTVCMPLEPMPRFAKILIGGLFALLVALLIGSFR